MLDSKRHNLDTNPSCDILAGLDESRVCTACCRTFSSGDCGSTRRDSLTYHDGGEEKPKLLRRFRGSPRLSKDANSEITWYLPKSPATCPDCSEVAYKCQGVPTPKARSSDFDDWCRGRATAGRRSCRKPSRGWKRSYGELALPSYQSGHDKRNRESQWHHPKVSRNIKPMSSFHVRRMDRLGVFGTQSFTVIKGYRQ